MEERNQKRTKAIIPKTNPAANPIKTAPTAPSSVEPTDTAITTKGLLNMGTRSNEGLLWFKAPQALRTDAMKSRPNPANILLHPFISGLDYDKCSAAASINQRRFSVNTTCPKTTTLSFLKCGEKRDVCSPGSFFAIHFAFDMLNCY